MHINEKLDKVGDKLVITVEQLQKLKINEPTDNKSINEILTVALHYCNTIITMKDISKKISLSLYKEDIIKQLRLIDEFIDLTEDIRLAA